jgi:4-hydroxy-4-methyl-2-oxoglutarate aldolase
VVGDVDVEPGDWVVGDADGVVVVPRATLQDVLAAGRARAERELGYFESLRGGATTLELLDLDTAPIDGA